MTLVGKALIVTIFVMSMLFMAFSMMTYSAHRDWPKLVSNTEAPLGLKQQLASARDRTRELEAEISRLRNKREIDRVSRVTALTVLESKAQQISATVSEREAEYAAQITQRRQAIETVQRSQASLAALSGEVETLREHLVATYEDRNKRLEEVVSLTDRLHQAQGVLNRLELRNNDLLERIAR